MAMPHCYLLGISVYYVHLLYVCLSNKLTTKCVSEMEYEFDKVCHVCQNTQMFINRLKNQNTATPVYLDVNWFCSLQAFQISCSSEAELPVSIPVLTSYFLLFCCRVFLLAHGVMLSGVSIIRVRSQWSFQCINGAVSTKKKHMSSAVCLRWNHVLFVTQGVSDYLPLSCHQKTTSGFLWLAF